MVNHPNRSKVSERERARIEYRLQKLINDVQAVVRAMEIEAKPTASVRRYRADLSTALSAAAYLPVEIKELLDR